MPEADADRERTGVMIGSGIGGLQSIAATALLIREKGPAQGLAVLYSWRFDQSCVGAREYQIWF